MIGRPEEGSVSAHEAPARTRQERVDAHPVGRALISALIVLTLVSMIVSNLPPSELRIRSMRAAKPILDVTGLHQNWNLFAPNPRRVTLQLVARITYADGTTENWSPPKGNPFVGVYRTFRWRKWASYVLNRANSHGLWLPTAAWVAQTHSTGGRVVTRVELIRRFYLAPRPGAGWVRPPWREESLVKLRVEGAGGVP
jgi:hypothetical protein